MDAIFSFCFVLFSKIDAFNQQVSCVCSFACSLPRCSYQNQQTPIGFSARKGPKVCRCSTGEGKAVGTVSPPTEQQA